MMIQLVSIFMFFMALISFSINRKHLLMMLLSLEFMVLSLYFLLYLYLSLMSMDLFFLMLFLMFTVCEGVLGLVILVLMVRVYGNDFFKSFSLLW
uniref:NADH-ubiquinone oxidoreductase chain 4L n=1 Tax=Tenebrionoidea sp. 24 KM-2017 TaxID=2219480 RepID=A0A346RJG0_9CUCU|nr:NADH dehydrogenase subunit 4L [Tenebrionoidea sp. 24 KM-2017]